jgi:hypothetical protein
LYRSVLYYAFETENACGVARTLTLAAVAFIGLLVPALLGMTMASPAIAKCNPNRTQDTHRYWDGQYRAPGATVQGVSSYILNYSPWVSPASSQTTAWPMLTVTTGQQLYAQVGWWEGAYDDRRTFVEWTPSSSSYLQLFFPAQPLDHLTNYKVLYNPVPSLTFDFYVNQTVVATQWANVHADGRTDLR